MFETLKKFFTIFVLPVLLLLSSIVFLKLSAMANEKQPTIHIFSSKTCPHCREAENFLQQLKQQSPSLTIYKYEIAYQQNSQLLTLLADSLEVDGQGVPFMLINNQAIIGFSTNTPAKIHELLKLTKVEEDEVVKIVRSEKLTPIIEELESLGGDQDFLNDVGNASKKPTASEEEIKLPFFGSISLKEVSLPILTVMIAFLDGFNPCAMWVLVFLISLLMGMKDRRRMWLLGSVFILSSGFVYFLFMSAWLNFFLFLGLVNWIRIAIAFLAIFAAFTYLKDYVKNKDGSCQVDLGGKKQRIFARLKEVVYRKSLLWSLLGIIILAFTVNLLELVCSAGLPAVYTKVLSMSELSVWQYYLYLVIYILIFMLDDMLVFSITMISMKRVVLNSKYARYSHLIGGIIMLIIGLLMLFKPEWIMFA
jgi:glutaredoxin